MEKPDPQTTSPKCSDTNERYWFQSEPITSVQALLRGPLGMTDDEFRRVFSRLCKELPHAN